MKTYIFILLSIFLIVSCNQQKSNNIKSKIEIEKSLVQRIDKASSMGDLFEKKNIISLETTDKCLIGEIESVIFVPEYQKIIILDSEVAKNIFVFDLEGRFLNRIGKNGKGPGEYNKPNQIAYENGKLIVYVTNLRKIISYKLDGTFIEEVNIATEEMYFGMKSILLFNNDFYGFADGPGYLNNNDKEESRVFRFRDCKNYDASFAGQPEETFSIEKGDITHFNNKIVFSGIYNGNIYQIDQDKKNVTLFISLGQLYNTSEAKKSKNAMMYILGRLNQIDAISRIACVGKLLFIQRTNFITIVDPQGKVLVKDLKNDIIKVIRKKEGKRFVGISMRLGFEYYDDGIIFAATNKVKINESEIPNPSLIFYKLKK